MISGRQRAAIAIVIATAFLAGCSGMRDGMHPVLAMDGDRMDTQDPVGNGRALLVTGQFGLAIDALSRLLHDDPGNVRALNLIAEAYARLHRYDLADRYHAEALQIDPNSVAALNNWGFSYLVRGDKARAMELLQRAEAIKGDQPVVLANLRLAGEDGAAPSAESAPRLRAVDDSAEVRVSEHVMLVRRTANLVRIAPGVQLLVTIVPAARQAPPTSGQAVRQSAAETAPLPYVAARRYPAGVDPSARNLAALQRLLDPFSFGVFCDIDDFNLMSGVGMGSTGNSGQAIFPPDIGQQASRGQS
jgi:tetratricopeptide (TPR) repeat protein